ncbi:MAG TPA: glutamate-1-semialdehyde 2,1-aminomutase [Smithellaceae bacterium]|jgi:glutamate-1-semialdehyde 2,1-aminomutase|nr:glutamate-1-semialdehyde 2,1-aminomutase [Syntrophaceae bacterium]HNV56273.1 glutamate-1-semialdehyde 2,1-aminomutase [Smithellaceae bacterium]HPV71362.1 glutamate-1-semialdehyde 2,1-aminomutase [Smithellaceae bacterium]HPY06343.1 glutamate-1-semialdehyde 2,1-aminomutase [Smithellaceae bacterium]HQC09551.1 glutamate-1-semialdehyde 2,1-aminomutase [Smithellaceae bacterium]
MNKNSIHPFAEAARVIAGGVNSPVRAWKSVGGDPLFVQSAAGSKIYDLDGKEYIDYVLSWGPMILGHAHPDVIAAVCDAARRGTSFGAPTTAETEMARLIREAIPSMERVRMTSSGTEAAMTAIRLARGCTGRNMIIKFDGCYHGHADSLLIKAGSGVTTLGIPGSPGIPEAVANLTLSLPYNDVPALKKAVELYAENLAAVILEPVAGNMGVVLPEDGFLKALREATAEHNILLIFDEVITGFRFRFGGCQNLAGIQPDLTCLGKIIGGGLPVGAVGGKKEIMERLAPAGDVYQAGTLSGNPLAMSAGAATLSILKSMAGAYAALDERAGRLGREMEKLFAARGIPICVNRAFSMFTLFFQEGPVCDLTSALRSDTDLYARFFHGMIQNGVWLAPSQFEAGFLSFAHTEDDMARTLSAVEKTLRRL